MSHEDVPKPATIPAHGDVEVITSIASPLDAHLSQAFEQLWLAASAGTCSNATSAGSVVHRRAIASAVSAWCAMEAGVNKALYFKLRHADAPYYLEPSKRKAYDKEISEALGGNLGFMKRLEYLADDKTCCSVISTQKGALKQFEKLRNSLVHGFVYRKEALAEANASSTSVSDDGVSSVVMTTFHVGHEEIIDPEGKKVDLLGNYKSLGLLHDPTRLCSHDAARCLFRSLAILSWLDSHYGVTSHASWKVDNRAQFWASRVEKTMPGSEPRIVGQQAAHDAYSAFDKKAQRDHNFRAVLNAKSKASKGRKPSRRKKR